MAGSIAYWIDKKNNVYESRDNHIIYIIAHPDLFGLTKQNIEDEYKKTKEKVGSEGKARRKIIDDVIGEGWIRVRLYTKTHWSITIAKLDRKTISTVTHFMNDITKGKIPNLSHPDIFMPVKITAVVSRKTNQDFTVKEIANGALNNGKPVVENRLSFVDYLNITA